MARRKSATPAAGQTLLPNFYAAEETIPAAAAAADGPVSPAGRSCTLHRLDISRGVLPAAAGWLLERAMADPATLLSRCADFSAITIVVPGRAAGHRLLELLVDQAAERGLSVVPPITTTLGQLPELLYQPARPLADTGVETLAWVAALAQANSRDRALIAPGTSSPSEATADAPHALSPQSPDRSQARLIDTARTLVGMHRELAASALGFADVATKAEVALPGFGDHARWEALARLERAYLTQLDSLQIWDRQTARRVAIAKGEIHFAGALVLLATVDIDPLQRQMLALTTGPLEALVAAPPDLSAEDFSACFDALGCLVSEAWLTRPIPVPLEQIEVVDDTDGQAQAVVGWLRRLAGKVSADEITLAVPDAKVAPALEQALAAAGLAGRYGAARTVARSTPYELLSAVFAWLAHEEFSALATLLRCPDAVSFLQARTGIPLPAALADGVATRHLPLAIDRTHLAAAADRPRDREENAAFLRLLDALDAWLEPLQRANRAIDAAGQTSRADAAAGLKKAGGRRSGRPATGKKSATASPAALPSSTTLTLQWAAAVRGAVAATLEGVAIDRDAPQQRVVATALEALGATLADLEIVPDPFALAAGSAGLARLLLSTWSMHLVPPVPLAEAIDIVGWLEVALDDAAGLAITSAVEGVLPTAAVRDPLLPEPLRMALELENTSRIAARDAWMLAVAAATRQALLVVVPRHKADGSPAVPSRLLFRRDPDSIVTTAQALFAPAPQAATVAAPAALASALLVPDPEQLMHSGGHLWPSPVPVMRVTEFKDYLACPYRYWLRHRLRLAPTSDAALELGAADFGTLIHECLDRFGKDPALKSATDAEALATCLSQILDRFVLVRYGSSAAPAVAVQAELARRRLKAFAAVQARRAQEGWVIHATEQHVKDRALEVDGVSIELSARIDRIDHHPATNTWQVLDYKTSARARTPEQTHRKRGEWIDLQLPLYHHLLPALEGVDANLLREARSIEVGYFNVPARIEEIAITPADWTGSDYAAADEVARHVVRQVRAGVFTPRNDRAAKSFPEFDGICQTHAILEEAAPDDGVDYGAGEGD